MSGAERRDAWNGTGESPSVDYGSERDADGCSTDERERSSVQDAALVSVGWLVARSVYSMVLRKPTLVGAGGISHESGKERG
eukprot:2398116-Prymnesium_polylepis.1